MTNADAAPTAPTAPTAATTAAPTTTATAAAATANPRPPVLQENLLDTLHRTGHFKYLMAAVNATGLTETLNGPGPYTVFAPNDRAFGRLSKAEVTDLFKPESKARLTDLVLLHVVPGDFRAAAYSARPTTLRTLLGEDLSINTAQGLRVNGARIVERDLEATNGVFHAIDTVLVPQRS